MVETPNEGMTSTTHARGASISGNSRSPRSSPSAVPPSKKYGMSAPSDDPTQIGRIAAVEVPGYADRGKLLRAPVVTVYQARNDGRAGTVEAGGPRGDAYRD